MHSGHHRHLFDFFLPLSFQLDLLVRSATAGMSYLFIRNAFSPLSDIWLALCVATLPTLKALASSPSLVFSPRKLSRIFMSHVWVKYGDPTDEGGRPVKEGLIRSRAKGVVVDLGAGHGHLLSYLDFDEVDLYVAIEPSTAMHNRIRCVPLFRRPMSMLLKRGSRRKKAAALGLNEERVLVIGCGMEDIAGIERAGLRRGSVDTIVSILTLCSVPDPSRTIAAFCRAFLNPDRGVFLFYEHVANPRPGPLWWQKRWSSVWSRLFDGCRLDRPTFRYLENVGIWGERKTWGKEGEDPDHLFWHQAGYLVRDPTL